MIQDISIPNKLLTARLHIEQLKSGDHEFMRLLVNSKGWLENIGDRNIHSENDAIAYVNKILATPNLVYWVVSIKDSATPIGIISFLKRTYLDHFDIGFAFLPQYYDHGYAFEATMAVLSALPKDPLFDIILATTKASNPRSIKLLIKLRFRLEKVIEIDNQKLLVYTNAALA